MRTQKILALASIFLLQFCFFVSSKAQVVVNGYGAPTTPMNVGGQQYDFKVKIAGNASACTSTSTLQITLPPGYIYVAGSAVRVGGSGNISEYFVSGGLARLYVQNIPAAPDSTVIQYKVYAGCGVIGSGASNDVDYVLNSCVGTNPASSNAFNAQNAQLNIQSVTNNNYTGVVGDIFTRRITISNDGFGAIDTLYLADTCGNGLYVSTISVNSGTITTTRTVSGSDTILKYKIVRPTANGFLNTNESIIVTETVRLLKCINLLSFYDAYYGPNGQKCAGVNNRSSAGASVNTAFQPNLIVLSSSNYPTCRGQLTNNWVKFINDGNATLRKAFVNIKQGTSLWVPPAETGEVAQLGFNPSSFKYKIGQNGSLNPIAMDSAKYFTISSCLSANMPFNAFFTLPDIAPGDTLIFYMDDMSCCPSACLTGSWLHWPGINVKYSYKNDCGDVLQDITTHTVRDEKGTYMSIGDDLPVTMVPGKDYSFKYDIDYSSFSAELFPNGCYVTFNLQLPAQVEFGGNASDIKFITRFGAPYSAPLQSYTYNTSTRVISVRLLVQNNTQLDELGRLFIEFTKLRVNCSLPGGNTNAVLSVSSQQVGCSGCSINHVCLSTAVDIWCPTPGCINGITVLDVTALRTNYGKPDNNDDGIPDATGSLDFSKIKTNFCIFGDTIEVTYRGKATVTLPTIFRYGYIEAIFSDKYQDFTPLPSSITIYSQGLLIGTSNNLLPVFSGSKMVTDFSINRLTGIPAAYTSFLNGDSLIIKTRFKVTGGNANSYAFNTLIWLDNEFYLSTVANPTNASNKYRCNAIDAKFRYLSITNNSWNEANVETYGCNDLELRHHQWIDIGGLSNGGNFFRYEYRNIMAFDSLKVFVPAGYNLATSVFHFWRTSGAQADQHYSAPLAPENPGGNPLIFKIRKLFASYGGTFPLSDEGSGMRSDLNFQPNCSTAPSGKARYHVVQSTVNDFPIPFSFTSTRDSASVTYDKAITQVTSSSQSVTVNSNNVSWEIQYSNLSPTADANNSWFAKNMASGVTINSVQILDGPGGSVVSTLNPVGGIYQLGIVEALDNMFLRINATYTSCIKDSLSIGFGWNCGAYPTSVATSQCQSNYKLYVTPQPANLQLSILNEPQPGSYQLCSRLDYEIKIINPALGNARQIRVRAQLPSSGGMAYVAGSYQLSVSSGSYTALSDANVNLSGNIINFTVPTAMVPLLASSDSLKIRLALQTNSCNFVSGQDLRFTPLGVNPCGSAILGTTQQTKKIQIQGAPTQNNVYSMSSTVQPVVACGAGRLTTPYHFRINNLGPNATSMLDGFSIEPPAPWKLDVSTITYTRNNTAAHYTTTTAGIYNFVTGANLPIGDSIAFNAQLYVDAADVPSLECGNSAPLKENATSSFTGTCQTSGVSCTVQEITTARESLTITVSKPNYSVLYFVAWSNNLFNSLNGLVTIQNNSSLFLTQNAVINVYKDNMNGYYDPSDILLGSQTLPLVNNITHTYGFNITNSSGLTDLCPMIVTVDFGCSCSDIQYPFSCNNVVLPVKFTEVTKQVKNCEVELQWGIESRPDEIARFDIQRSIDNGRSFATIDTISNNARKYTDVKPAVGKNLYRIVSIEMNGNKTISNVIAADINCGFENKATVIPNPANTNSEVALTFYTMQTNRSATLIVQDIMGKTISANTVFLQKGFNNLRINNKGLASGTYLVKLVAAGNLLAEPVKFVLK